MNVHFRVGILRPEARVFVDVLSQGAAAWMDRAACAGHPNPEWWFPTQGERTEAADICAGCRVRDECLDYAIENQIEEGCWGGLSARGRVKARRNAQRGRSGS